MDRRRIAPGRTRTLRVRLPAGVRRSHVALRLPGRAPLRSVLRRPGGERAHRPTAPGGRHARPGGRRRRRRHRRSRAAAVGLRRRDDRLRRGLGAGLGRPARRKATRAELDAGGRPDAAPARDRDLRCRPPLLGAAGIDAVHRAVVAGLRARLARWRSRSGATLYSRMGRRASFAALAADAPAARTRDPARPCIDMPFLALGRSGRCWPRSRHGARTAGSVPICCSRSPACCARRRGCSAVAWAAVGRRRTAAGPAGAGGRWRSPRRCCGRRMDLARDRRPAALAAQRRSDAGRTNSARPRGLEARRCGSRRRTLRDDADGARSYGSGSPAAAAALVRLRIRARCCPRPSPGSACSAFLVLGVARAAAARPLPAAARDAARALVRRRGRSASPCRGRASGPGEPAAPRSWRCSR